MYSLFVRNCEMKYSKKRNAAVNKPLFQEVNWQKVKAQFVKHMTNENDYPWSICYKYMTDVKIGLIKVQISKWKILFLSINKQKCIEFHK